MRALVTIDLSYLMLNLKSYFESVGGVSVSSVFSVECLNDVNLGAFIQMGYGLMKYAK